MDRYEYFQEMNNNKYLGIVKVLKNDDDEQLWKMFRQLIKECCVDNNICDKLTKVDCFCVLLTMYIVCVSGVLKLKMQDENGTILHLQLTDILDMVANYEQEYKQKVKVDKKITVELKIPHALHETEIDDIILNSIDKIYLFNKQFNFTQLSLTQKRSAFERLPSEVSDQIIRKMSQINENYQIKIFEIEQDQPMIINMYSNSMYELIKMMYNADLESLYYNRYIASKHMKYSNEYVESITPAELQLHMKFLEKEIAEQKKELEKQSGASPGVGNMPSPPGGM